MPPLPVRFVLLLAVALSATAAAQSVVLDGRRCATPPQTIAQGLDAQRVTRAYRAAGAFLRAADEPITVPVAFHVIRSGESVAEGNVPDAWIAAQVDTLNSAFRDDGLRFALSLVQRIDNATWYDGLRLGSAEESAMKSALARDPSRVLNLYSVSPALDFLGWATLPQAGAETASYQGVVLLDQSMPGGAAAPYDLGHTGTHEVGHWAGLEHTFSGGCSQPNDGVADTPQERSGASGCPTTRDSCPSDPGFDPVHNYMDYSDDACMTEFTVGQAERMRALMTAFRPTIAQGGYALAMVPRGALDALFVGVETVTPIRVTNASAVPLAVVGASSDRATARLPRTVLAPGAAAVIDLAIRPTERGEIEVQIETDGAVPAAPLRLEGFATRPPTARLDRTTVDGRLIEDAQIERTLTLANDGEGALQFAIDPDALPPWVAAVEPLAGTVLADGSVEIAVTLSSAGLAPGAFAETVPIATNDPLRPEVALSLALDVLVRPTALAAGRVFPNPTRGPVTIPLELPDEAAVTADVIDLRGRVVAVLADAQTLPAGYPELTWDAAQVAPGLYLVRVRTASAVAVTRVTVTR